MGTPTSTGPPGPRCRRPSSTPSPGPTGAGSATSAGRSRPASGRTRSSPAAGRRWPTWSAGWRPGDEVVVSRLDHDANVRPWVQAAARAGAVVRWAEVDLATGELRAGQYEGLVGERTKLVAVSAASNVLGTRPD